MTTSDKLPILDLSALLPPSLSAPIVAKPKKQRKPSPSRPRGERKIRGEKQPFRELRTCPPIPSVRTIGPDALPPSRSELTIREITALSDLLRKESEALARSEQARSSFILSILAA